MLKKSAGNMYDWVTHTHSHLCGECPHKCSYCYVQRNRFGVAPRYQGKVRLIEAEFAVQYGAEKTIFIEHMNDMFAADVPDGYIVRILEHCYRYPSNKYVFQTKNPSRAALWLLQPEYTGINKMIGTTMESNRPYAAISTAPSPIHRRDGMVKFIGKAETFVTVEPILDLDVAPMVALLADIKPAFINIGADSKHCNLPEPTPAKVKEFVAQLQAAGIVIRKKVNLKRMLA